MKTARWMVGVALCAVIMFCCLRAGMAATVRKPAQTPPQQAAAARPTPGVEAAKTISMITGVAISPLLGVGAVGAYTWWKAPEEKRGQLDWYAQPWFWIPALLLVSLIGVKDILGTAAPMALKKPFDVAETIENKVSGLVAAGAFLPLIISIFPEAAGGNPEVMQHSIFAGAGLAAIDAGSIGNMLLIPLALAVFVVVWLASHAINILILLSPFTTLDTALKVVRLAILSLVAGTAFTSPYLGAAVAVAIIVLAYFIAGWSFRLSFMGTVYVWDFVTLRRHRFQPGTESNKVFLARTMEGAPLRSYGRLVHEKQGSLTFEYRPWLVLAKERFTISEGAYVVGRGVFYPEISFVDGERLRSRFILPPRYCGHEDAMARAYGLAGVRDVGVRKGFKAAWRWIRGLFREEPARQEIAPA